ncbi:DUF4369 domain-containing protein [Pseudotenacibaculum haliotis]|uniref:DUF4369 domain-containing protein n=1 Tax=Pseudotenacibaculum haliotis TaxID=1862138 RepID=A0ABW5LPF3_9FLAO
MKKVFVLCLLVALAACSKEKKQGNMIVQGQIKGLKKGTLYLQKMKDTLLVSVDSIALLGKDQFLLSDNVDSPVMYYLTFDGNTTEKRIMFFGEQGTITINDNLKNFGFSPLIEGSKNQKVYEDYKKMTTKFQGKQLDLFQENFKAQKENDVKKSDSLRKLSEEYVKKRYLFSINFAMNHPDDEASAYIALTDLVDANVKYLDTINNSLSDKVKTSLYGKKLAEFIEKIKKEEPAN